MAWQLGCSFFDEYVNDGTRILLLRTLRGASAYHTLLAAVEAHSGDACCRAVTALQCRAGASGPGNILWLRMPPDAPAEQPRHVHIAMAGREERGACVAAASRAAASPEVRAKKAGRALLRALGER